jgi:dihydroorotate dehydrogenase (fumarate)
MANLETTYMNLKLKNPIIVGSSGLTQTADKIKAAEKAGAGAVVVKSLFEENLSDNDWDIMDDLRHTEESDMAAYEIEKLYGSKDYIDLIKKVKKEVKIPIIASINCTSASWWAKFAKQVEAAGADAVELNIAKVMSDLDQSADSIEEIYVNALKSVKEEVKIPVAIKISPYFTSVPNLAYKLDNAGADAIVMFNYFTLPDIDVHKLELKTTFSFSNEGDYKYPMRWIGILSGSLDCDLSGTTGIKNHEDVLKMLLSGATTVQLASVLYQNGVETISDILNNLEKWMDERNLNTLEKIRGKMSFDKIVSKEKYLWMQFMKKKTGLD